MDLTLLYLLDGIDDPIQLGRSYTISTAKDVGQQAGTPEEAPHSETE